MIDQTQTRRSALAWLAAGVAVPVLAACGSAAEAKTYKVSFSDNEWRQKLTSAQYAVLREEHTEPPFSSPFAMLARAAQDEALWPHALALAWQIAWVALSIRLGAALFRKRVMKSGPRAAKRRWGRPVAGKAAKR